MKNYLLGMIAIAGAVVCCAFNKNAVIKPPAGVTYYLFVIDFDSLTSKSGVENVKSWRFLEEYTNKSLLCEQGKYLACQLMIDKRDTELPPDTHQPQLRQDVMLRATLNTSSTYYYVSGFVSPHMYTYEIINGGE
jgi:hypothetical protein